MAVESADLHIGTFSSVTAAFTADPTVGARWVDMPVSMRNTGNRTVTVSVVVEASSSTPPLTSTTSSVCGGPVLQLTRPGTVNGQGTWTGERDRVVFRSNRSGTGDLYAVKGGSSGGGETSPT